MNSNEFLDHLSLLSNNSKEAIAEKEEEEWIITETTVECDEISAGENRQFRRVLKVPPLQPVIDNCELVQVCYRIWIRAKSEGNRRETLVLPLIIGTVPLRNNQGVPESQIEEQPKLKLTIPSQTQCQCTCPCPHCSKIKIVTNAVGSPEMFDPQMVPQTPMSPTTSPFEAIASVSSEIIDNSKIQTLTNEIAG